MLRSSSPTAVTAMLANYVAMHKTTGRRGWRQPNVVQPGATRRRPWQSFFPKLMRFDSWGCVRVQTVRALAPWLRRDPPGGPRQHFEATIKTGENTPVELSVP